MPKTKISHRRRNRKSLSSSYYSRKKLLMMKTSDKDIGKKLTPFFLENETTLKTEFTFENESDVLSQDNHLNVPVSYINDDNKIKTRIRHKNSLIKNSPSKEPITELVSKNNNEVIKRKASRRKTNDDALPQNDEINKLQTTYLTSVFCESKFHIVEDVNNNIVSEDFVMSSDNYLKSKKDEFISNFYEYSVDEQDLAWLELVNIKRKKVRAKMITIEVFEKLMTYLESHCKFQTNLDELTSCFICLDGKAGPFNLIVFCDICNLSIHQECYGVPYISSGQWICRVCQERPSKPPMCMFCFQRGGAFKKTDKGLWVHIICGIWIPEVYFANLSFLEPIFGYENIPILRWKMTCSICNKKRGACIVCQFSSCNKSFHVPCAQEKGYAFIIRNEGFAPKYMVYCEQHYFKKMREKIRPMTELENLTISRRRSCSNIVHPTISQDDINMMVEIAGGSSRIIRFIKQLKSYWLLKRQTRFGVPLIRMN